jgi:hypothetical protein
MEMSRVVNLRSSTTVACAPQLHALLMAPRDNPGIVDDRQTGAQWEELGGGTDQHPTPASPGFGPCCLRRERCTIVPVRCRQALGPTDAVERTKTMSGEWDCWQGYGLG